MSLSVEETLRTLQDVQGIVGSCLFQGGGEMLAQDLPSFFGTAAEEVGPRIARLHDAAALADGRVSHFVIRYGQHKLSSRPLDGAILAVLSQTDVNMPALRMAMNLVARKLTQVDLSQVAADQMNPNQLPRDPTEANPVTQRAMLPTDPSLDAAPPAAPPSQARGHGAPEAHRRAPTRTREVFFRGKRVGG